MFIERKIELLSLFVGLAITMIYIATTRFNNETFGQNERWRTNNDCEGCIYGTPMKMKEDIPIGMPVLILEMNNDKNLIEGVGLVSNNLALDKQYRIYNWGNYNRFTYKGEHRIPRDQLTSKELVVFKVLDMLVFKGQRHLKRGQGITSLPQWILLNKQIDFRKEIAKMFTDRFKEVVKSD